MRIFNANGRKNWDWGCLLALVCMIPFLRAWNYGMIDLDDYAYLTFHSQLWEGPFLRSLTFFFTDVSEAIWMPLTWISYAIDYAVFGEWMGGFHLHSILVHGVNSALVWILLREILASRRDGSESGRAAFEWACLAGALLWAVHPLRCESVVFLASRKDVLSFFWELLALIFWVRGSKAEGARELRLSTFAMAFFVLGSMCKPSVMTFPALCLILDALVFRKIVVVRYLTPFAFAVFLGLFASWQQKSGGAMADATSETLLMRLADSVAAFGIYLKNTVWPADLAVQCVKRWPDMPRFLWPGIVLSALYGGYLLYRLKDYRENYRLVGELTLAKFRDATILTHRTSFSLAGLMWFAVAVFPMLGFVSFGYHAFADRFTYIPAVGLSLVAADIILRIRWRRLGGCVAALLVLALAAITWRQTGYWRNDCTLFTRTLEVDGDGNGFAHKVLGEWYFEFPHDLDKCIDHYEKSIEIDRKYTVLSHCLYMFALCEAGRTENMSNVLNDYWKFIAKDLTPDQEAEVWQGHGTKDLNIAKNVYMSGKVAWWITDPTTISSAEEYLNNMTGKGLDDPAWLYLRMLLSEKKGDAETAARCREELIHPSRRKTGYAQFKYLRSAKKE